MEERLGLRLKEGHQEKEREPDVMMELILQPLAEEHVVGTGVWLIGNMQL